MAGDVEGRVFGVVVGPRDCAVVQQETDHVRVAAATGLVKKCVRAAGGRVDYLSENRKIFNFENGYLKQLLGVNDS